MSEKRFADNGVKSVEAEPYSTQFWQDVSIYTFLWDAYNNVGGFKCVTGSYITGSSAELFYQTRVKLSHNRPWYGMFVDCQVDPLFDERDVDYETDAITEDLLENANGAMMSIDDYQKNVLTSSINNGVVFLASGSTGEEGDLPYFFYYTAGQYNVELSIIDNRGRVEKYVFSTKIDDNLWRHDIYTDTYVQNNHSSTRDAIGEQIKNTDEAEYYVEVSEQVIFPLYSQRKEQLKVLVNPKNAGIAELCLALYEQTSEYRWTLNRQTNDILVIRGDSVNGVISPTDAAMNIEAGDSGAGAEFISPGSDNPKNQLEGVNDTKKDLFEFMHQNGVIVYESTQLGESGYAKTFTFQPRGTALSKTRKMAHQVIAYMKRVVDAAYGGDHVLSAEYKSDFTPKSSLTVLDIKDAIEVFLAAGATEAVKASLKLLASLVSEDNDDLQGYIEELPLKVGNDD